VFIFRRLKINHDSHEFILEYGTVASSIVCSRPEDRTFQCTEPIDPATAERMEDCCDLKSKFTLNVKIKYQRFYAKGRPFDRY
jgi:hypothetical protein